MKVVTMWFMLFIVGACWRGKKWLGWLVFFFVYATMDLICLLINNSSAGSTHSRDFVFNFTETLWRDLFVGVGLIFGATVTLLASINPRHQRSFTPWPTVLSCIVLALSDTVFGRDIEELIPVVAIGCLLATGFMMQGTWGADLLYVICGIIIVAPLMNLGTVHVRMGFTGFESLVEANALISDEHMGTLNDKAVAGLFVGLVIVAGLVSLPISVVKFGRLLNSTAEFGSRMTEEEKDETGVEFLVSSRIMRPSFFHNDHMSLPKPRTQIAVPIKQPLPVTGRETQQFRYPDVDRYNHHGHEHLLHVTDTSHHDDHGQVDQHYVGHDPESFLFHLPE